MYECGGLSEKRADASAYDGVLKETEPQGDHDSVSLRSQQIAQAAALGLRHTVLQLDFGG